MSNFIFRSFWSVVIILFMSSAARGQIPYLDILGKDTVCSNAIETYNLQIGSNTYSQIDWYITGGNTVSITNNNKTRSILWGAHGTAQIIVNAWDTVGSLPTVIVKRDTLVVTVLATPTPVIKSDVRMACQPLDQPPQGNPPGQFDDSGCFKVCAYSTITYTAMGNPTSTYVWTVQGDISHTTSGPTCTVNWYTPGAGKISVEETTLKGCKGTIDQCIEIVESPIARPVALPDTNAKIINVCKGSEVIFIDRSRASLTSPIVAWKWDFGDGAYSNEKGGVTKPISHKYNVPGSYTVKLTVTNQCGCSTTDTLRINVSAAPAVKVVCPSLVCEGSSYNYTVSASCPGGTWQVIGGTINSMSFAAINITWNAVSADGFGYIIYTAGSCAGYCPFPVVVKIPVVKTSGTITGPEHLCVNDQYLYSMPQWPTTTCTWSASSAGVILKATDQPNEIVLIPNAAVGAVTLTCNYTNTLLGCTGTATKVIQIRPPMVVAGMTKVCAGGEYQYQITGFNASSAKWKLVDPNNNVILSGPDDEFSHYFGTAGTYVLTVTGDFCPPPPLEIRVVPVPPVPDNILGPDRICRGVPTEYTAEFIDPAHIFTWSITNGQVNIASGQSSDITLNTGSSGPFLLSVVRETKELPHCQSLPKTKVIGLPAVDFEISGTTTVCPSESYPYTVDYPDGEAYDWSIFPETMGSIMQPLTTSDGQGTAKVNAQWNRTPGTAKLVCRIRKCNTFIYDTLTVTVRSLAVNMTLPDSVCLYGSVTLHVDEEGGGVQWNTGLGFVYGNDLIYSYTKPVNILTKYYVIATVNAPFGCVTKSTVRDSIIVKPAPITRLTPLIYHVCDTATINAPFNITYDLAYPAPTSYQWTQSGVNVSTSSGFTATDTGGITVLINGPYGCPAYHETGVYEHYCGLDGDATVPGAPGCPPAYLNIDTVEWMCNLVRVKVKHSANYFYDYQWTPSPSSSSYTDTTADLALYPQKAGIYKVSYLAKYQNLLGTTTSPICNLYAERSFVVPFVPHLDVIPQCSVSGNKRLVKIIDNSSYIAAPDKRVLFINNNRVDSNKLEYNLMVDTNSSFGSSGQRFMIRLSSTTSPNIVCSFDTLIKITKLPVANFTFLRDTTCEKDAAVHFTNTSAPTGLKYLWNFGDVAESEKEHPERVYDDNNGGFAYSVNLIATDPWGCSSSISQPVAIRSDQLSGSAEITPSYPCQYNTAIGNFSIGLTSTNPILYNWLDVNKVSWGGTKTIPITRSGAYYVHTEDKYGCYLNTPMDTVTFVRAPRAYIYGDTGVCRNKDFTLGAYVGQVPGLVYQWERDNVIIPSSNMADLLQNLTPGRYKFNVTTSTPNPSGGVCSNRSDDFYVTIHDTPSAPRLVYTVLNCNNYNIRISVTNFNAAGTYNWSNGMTGAPVNVDHGGPYQVIYTDQHGCTNKGRIQTDKDLREYMWVFPKGCYSLCYTRQNIIRGPVIPFTQWNYKKGLANVATGAGVVTPFNLNTTGAGNYNLFLQNAWCSLLSDTMFVDFNCTYGMRQEYTEVGSLTAAAPEMYLAPNPAGNSTRVSYSYLGNAACYLQVYNMVGRTVYTAPLPGNKGDVDLDLSLFTPGAYHVVMRQNGMLLKQATLSVIR